MKNCYFDSPLTIQRLKYEPDVTIYRNGIAPGGNIQNYCRCHGECRYDNDSFRAAEIEIINAAVSAAIRNEFSKIRAAAEERAATGRKDYRRRPYDFF